LWENFREFTIGSSHSLNYLSGLVRLVRETQSPVRAACILTQ
jgi:hypothetical protein